MNWFAVYVDELWPVSFIYANDIGSGIVDVLLNHVCREWCVFMSILVVLIVIRTCVTWLCMLDDYLTLVCLFVICQYMSDLIVFVACVGVIGLM